MQIAFKNKNLQNYILFSICMSQAYSYSCVLSIITDFEWKFEFKIVFGLLNMPIFIYFKNCFSILHGEVYLRFK